MTVTECRDIGPRYEKIDTAILKMQLHPNNQLLVDAVTNVPLFENRYRDVKLVNFDSLAGQRGCFSIVFRAFDTVNQETVALKFFDLDPIRLTDQYRRAAFVREHQILSKLVTVERCLKLTSGLMTFDLVIPKVGFVIPCSYFAVEWIDDEIDEFFLNQGKIDALNKLKLFNEIVLSVETLHVNEVFHRDLKADNLRSYQDTSRRIVVAIDLGTAARLDSAPVQTEYRQQVGAPGYAAPEALCGLTANRAIAKYTDLYALGCLLYELFNPDYFYYAVRKKNSAYDHLLGALSSQGLPSDEASQIIQWNKSIDKLAQGIAPVKMNEFSGTTPLSIAELLDDIIFHLTHFDYRQRRKGLNWVRQRIWSAIRVLENQNLSRKKVNLAKERRRLSHEKALAKDARANQRLKNK